LKQGIIQLLKDNPQGLTIQEIGTRLGVSRHTAAIYLAELKGEGNVAIREIGMAKLHLWRGKE